MHIGCIVYDMTCPIEVRTITIIVICSASEYQDEGDYSHAAMCYTMRQAILTMKVN